MFGMQYEGVPLHTIHLDTALVKGEVVVGVRKQFPVEGVSFILGNDLAEGKVLVTPEVTAVPLSEHPDELRSKYPGVFSVCAMTRARSKQEKQSTGDEGEAELCDSFMAHFDPMGCAASTPVPPTPPVSSAVPNADSSPVNVTDYKIGMSREQLINEQKCNQSLTSLFDSIVSEDDINEKSSGYFVNGNVLMRKWTPPYGSVQDDWCVVKQIIVPQKLKALITFFSLFGLPKV